MKYIISKHKLHWSDRSFLKSATLATVLLLISLVINYFAGSYATQRASNSVSDLILSNIRVFDVDGFFVYGAFLFWGFMGFLFLLEPQKIPFAFKSIALLVIIRALFITLTHIGPYPNQVPINSDILSKFSPGGDLFFSGHTGLPFLMALIYWQHKTLRVLFIVIAIIFGIVVLMGHLHYTIDVLSAFFITYAIYRLAEIFFKEDKKTFTHGLH